MKRTVPFYPVLVALFPILSLFAHNIANIPISLAELLLPIAVSLLITAVAFGIMFAISRDVHKSALTAALFVFLIFSYGHFLHVYKAILGALLKIKPGLTSEFLFLVNYFIAFVLAVSVVIKSKRDFAVSSRLLNFTAIVLLAIPVSTASFRLSRIALTTKEEESGERAKRAAQHLPDIYYIILDAYARADVLKKVYDYDNTEFINELEKRGFFVAGKSCANYPYTFLSLPSSLNMTYLDDLARRVGYESTDRRPLEEMIGNPRIVKTLRPYGYKYIIFSSGYSIVNVKKGPDLLLPPRHRATERTEFHDILLNTTPMPLISDILPRHTRLRSRFDVHAERILYIFKHVPEMADAENPVFVLAHILCPHPPFVFDRNGNRLRSHRFRFTYGDGSMIIKTEEDRKEYRKRYREQVIFVNRMVLEMVDEILSKSKVEPIIILQGDHGARSHFYYEDPKHTEFNESMCIFNAYRLPNGGNELLYDSITPVNTFRIIANRYFGGNYELLPDRQYYARRSRLYKFIEVTEKINH